MNDDDLIFEETLNNQLNVIVNRCKEILEEEIERNVYDKYSPTTYKRTYGLRDNIRTDIKNGVLYLYINTGNTDYKANNDEEVNNKVPFYVNYGHNSNYSERFMYYQYPSRGFIESAKEKIERELGLEVEIMNDYND